MSGIVGSENVDRNNDNDETLAVVWISNKNENEKPSFPFAGLFFKCRAPLSAIT